MFLSIIISVYNLESYISQCLSTIVAQDFDDYEVVLVDDGSSDGSGELCLKYARDYPWIKFFKKRNGGASSARNFGLEKANGKYIIFMDGDDFLDGTSFFSELSQKAEDSPDFLLYGCRDYNDLSGISKVSRSNYGITGEFGSSKKKVIDHLIEHNNFPGAAWLFCVKKGFLLRHQILFREGVRAEDLDWIFTVFHHACKMAFLDGPFYMYRKNRSGSVTKTFDRRSIDGLLYFIEKWAPFVIQNKEMEKMMYVINYHYIILIVYADGLSNNDIDVLHSNRYVLDFSHQRLFFFMSLFVKTVGIKIANMIFHRLLSYGSSK